jgi:hypothetical protein
MPLVSAAITGAINLIADIATNIADWIKRNQGLIDTLAKIAGIILGALGQAFGFAFEWLGRIVDAVGFVISIFGKAWDVISSIGGKIFDALIGSIRNVIDFFGKLWDTISSTADKITRALTDLFKPLSDSFNKVMDGIKGAWDTFARFWNSIGIDIPQITIPNPFGGNVVVGGGRFELPKLPVLDRGGIVTGPTLAMLAANSRPEAIVPLDRMPAGITVNVYAGVGDPVRIGQEIVQAIHSFERANGPAFAPPA